MEIEKENSIPETIREAVAALYNVMNQQTIEEIMELDDPIHLHMDLGMWIRNYWIYPLNSPLKEYFDNRDEAHNAKTHIDEMSQEIVELFWKELREANNLPIEKSLHTQ